MAIAELEAEVADQSTIERVDQGYPCSICGRDDVPFEAMTHVTKNKNGVGARCLPCNNTHKRAQERRLRWADRGDDGTIVEPAQEPDPSPPRMLAELMAYDRTLELKFEDVFEENAAFVIARITGGKGSVALREDWRVALDWARPYFARAYSGQQVSRLTPSLLADDSSPAPCQ